MSTAHKGTIRAYDAVTHTASVQLTGSLAHFLAAIRVATNIPSAAVVIGRECTVLALDPNNPTDALVLSIQGALPPAGGGGVQALIRDADADTYVNTEQAADEDNVRFAVAAVQRLLLQATSPHLTLTGDLKVTANLGLQDATVNALYGVYSYKSAPPAGWMHYRATPQGQAAGDLTCFAVYPAALTMAASSTVRGVAGFAAISAPSGATAGVVQGLYFYAAITGGGPATSINELSAIKAQAAVSAYTGTVATIYGLNIPTPSIAGGTPAVTTTYGAFIGDQGCSTAITNAYGLHILDMTLNTGFRRLLEIGAPYLRVVGAPAPDANLTNVYMNEGGTLRRVQWVDPGNAGVNLVPGQRVMVLV